MTSAQFPQRMLELLQQMATEKPDVAHGGLWQYADGTPMQMDAQAALKWIGGADCHDMKAAFEFKYQRDWNDPAGDDMKAVWTDAWVAATATA